MTSVSGGEVDSGPRSYYGNQVSYRKLTQAIADRLGQKIVDYIVNDLEFDKHDTEYPDGPPLAVSYFDVGVQNAEDAGTHYSPDITESEAYKKYWQWVTALANRLGQTIYEKTNTHGDHKLER